MLLLTEWTKSLLIPTLVTLGVLLSYQADALEPAVEKALEAAYKQTGTEKFVKKKLKYWEKQYVPHTWKPYLGTAFAIGKMIEDKQIKGRISRNLEASYTFKGASVIMVNYKWNL